jgi:membrane-associated protein
VLVALLLGGCGLPLPEDVALLAAGYLVWRGDAPAALLGPAALGAIVLSDMMLYGFGRALRNRPLLGRLFAASRLERLERAFGRHGVRLILVARVAIGARALFFLAAGVTRMPFARFVLWDLLGACVMVTAWIVIGMYIGPRIDEARPWFRQAETVVISIIGALCAAEICHRCFRFFARRTKP